MSTRRRAANVRGSIASVVAVAALALSSSARAEFERANGAAGSGSIGGWTLGTSGSDAGGSLFGP